MRIMDSAVNSTAIFGQVLKYMTTRLDETTCDWITQIESTMGSDKKGWRYHKGPDSNQTELELLDTALDILETLAQIQGDDDVNCAWCHDLDNMPEELEEQIDDLTYLWHPNGTRTNLKLAILKYTAWKTGGVVWNQEFVTEMGFDDDQHLMESMMFSLKDLLLSTDRKQEETEKMNMKMMNNDADPAMAADPTMASKCDLLDPVELINIHYTNTIRELSSVFAEWRDLGIPSDVTIALSFGATIGGGIGFAVNGRGETILYNTVRSPLSINPIVPEQGANLVVTVGVYEDLQSVNGFGITNKVDDSFPDFPNTVFAAMSENEDGQWMVNGVLLEASFDPIESEYRFESELPFHSRWSTPIASLVSTKCALEAHGVDIDEWKQQYPMIQPLDIELDGDAECGVTEIMERESHSIRILEYEANALPQRRKVKNPERKTHGMITLVFMGAFMAGLVYIGMKVDWIYLINGGRSQQITFLDGEQEQPLITKLESEEAPEIVIW